MSYDGPDGQRVTYTNGNRTKRTKRHSGPFTCQKHAKTLVPIDSIRHPSIYATVCGQLLVRFLGLFRSLWNSRTQSPQMRALPSPANVAERFWSGLFPQKLHRISDKRSSRKRSASDSVNCASVQHAADPG